MLERMQGRLNRKAICGGVYISCLGRGRYRFGPYSEQLKMIAEVLGAFPLAGILASRSPATAAR